MYAKVTSPALGIFAIPTSPSDLFPWMSPTSEGWEEAQTWLDTTFKPLQQTNIAKFDSEAPNSSVLQLSGANHYVFLSDRERVSAEILGFLSGT